MKCCENHEDKILPLSEIQQKKEVEPSDQFSVTFSIDKLLSFVLIGLIVGTIVVGYTVVSNKNKTQAAPNSTNTNSDDMASHHGGGNKKFEPLAQGSVAPDFSLPSTVGKVISLADYKGKNVLLFFNEGVMCSPCWQEISRLERFKDEFESLNTVIIPVSVDDRKTWDPILVEERITTPILIDTERKVTSMYKALGTPSSMHDDRAGHTYIHINTEGKIHSSADFPNMNVPTNDLIQHIQQTQT
ncbi:redoxin domain-containing protein [Candidatus Roizmanbacteria bacterium]|nr:redoxin domain-containing protein [Candidatus Roizmanbacteria bacterium]